MFEVRWYVIGSGRTYWHCTFNEHEVASKKVQELRTIGFKWHRKSGVVVFVPASQIKRIEVRPNKAKLAARAELIRRQQTVTTN